MNAHASKSGNLALGILFAALVPPGNEVVAQVQASPHHWEHVNVRSGVHDNPTPVEGVVYQTLITMPAGTAWMRLFFSSVHLDGQSYLRLAALRDGGVQTLRAHHLAQWQNASAFFNGGTVLLELVAGPQTQGNRVDVERVMAADLDARVPPTETICGSSDNRVPSNNPAVGRIVPIGCSGWISNVVAGTNDRLHLSAGHCFAPGQIVEFNVPASSSDCSVVHPPPSLQFAIDPDSIASNGGPGNDYWVFRCYPNPTTGLTTFQAQGAAIALAPALPANGTAVQVLGFGIDGTDTNNSSGESCTCSGTTGQRNHVQQSSSGTVREVLGTQINHDVDTCGGNSGSVVIDSLTAAAVAIHTNAGCSTSGTYNSGTALANTNLQLAIDALSVGRSAAVAWRHAPDRYAHGAAFHPGLQRVIAFGGTSDDSADLGDTTSYDPNRGWTRLVTNGSPGPLTGAAMAPEASIGVLLFGGGNSGGLGGSSTWRFDGNVWAEWPPVGPQPLPRTGHAMAFDSFRGRVVMFGGDTGAQFLGDTWEWDATNGWVQVSTAFSPPPTRKHAMSYDVLHREVVMQGGQDRRDGSLSTTYLYDGTNWRSVGTGSGLRLEHAMASDDQGRTLMYGGLASLSSGGTGNARSDTWLWNGAVWTQVGQESSPGRPSLPVSPDAWGRFGHTMTWDPGRRVFVVLNGRAGGLRPTDGYRLALGSSAADTLEWDPALTTPNWTSRPSLLAPAARLDAAAAFNRETGEILVFGGSRVQPAFWQQGSIDTAGDFWRFANGTWTVTANGAVPGRARHAMCWDMVRREYVIFGGIGAFANPQGFVNLGDTWTGSPAAGWQQRTTGPSGPSARAWAAMVSTPGGVLLYGGGPKTSTDTHATADFYRWDGTTWNSLGNGAPGPLVAHAMAYDRGRDRVVLFGGEHFRLDERRPAGTRDETWEWDGGQWLQRFPAHSPPRLALHAMTYDAARERVVLFGGVDNRSVPRSEVWEWDGSDWTNRAVTTPIAARLSHSMVYDEGSQQVVSLFGEAMGLVVVGPWEYGPTRPARVDTQGVGCPGSLGPVTISTAGNRLPWLGSTLPVQFGNLPASSVPFLVLGLTRVQIDLGPLGLPGCTQYTTIDASHYLGVPIGGVATFNQYVPTATTFVGMQVYFQGAALGAGGNNALGEAITPVLEVVIGER